jgi:lysophospholipase L1-like esterase
MTKHLTALAATLLLVTVTLFAQKLPPNSRIIYFGDSQTEFAYGGNGNVVQYQNYGYVSWVNALAPGMQTPKGGVLGIGGQTTTQMLSRLNTISTFDAKFICVLAGTNDPLYGIGPETTKANLRKIYDAGIANGMKVIAICILPRFSPNTYNATTEANRININNWIKTQADVVAVDAEAELNGAENFEDGLHNSPLGAYKLGNKVATAINKLVFACTPGSQLAADLSRSSNSNPLLTGSAGKLNTATGTVATNWELNAGFAGGATVSGSKETDADGRERQVINISGSYSTSTRRVTFNNYAALPISLAAGDVVEGISEIEIASAMTNIRGIYLKVIVYDNAWNILSDGCSMFPTSNKPLNMPAGKYILRTPAMTIGAGTPGQLITQVWIEFNSTTTAVPVAATLKLSSAGVRRLPLATGPLSTITPAGTVSLCPGATQVLTANAGSGYTYQWKLNGSNLSSANASAYSATTTGSYTVAVTAPGCSVLSDPTTIVAANCTTNTVTTGSVPAKLCAGSSVNVPFTVSNAFSSGNLFTAQLSNASGSFTSPVNIGSFTSTGAGTINATIPSSTPQGTGYRIRVIASSPAATGSDNGTAIGIFSIPVLNSTTRPPAICNNSIFNYTPTATPAGTTFTWSRSVVSGIANAAASGTGSVSETLQNTTAAPVNVSYVYQLNNNGCSSTNTVVVTVNPSPIARAKNISANLGAGGSVSITPQQVDNGSTGSCGTLQYSLDKTQFTCANIGNNTVTLTITDGAGNRSSATATVTVTDANGVCVVNANNITTGSVATKLCSGQAIDVPYSVSNAFAAGNSFTAQLSNATGSFASPVTIGSLSATGAGVIKATVPANTAQGTGYRIRVIASNPAAIGTDNGANITINAIPVFTSTLTPPAVCNNSIFNYTPTATPAGTTLAWSRAVVAGVSNAAASGAGSISETLVNTTTAPINVSYVYQLNNDGCSSVYTVVVTVNPSPVARAKNISVNLGTGGTVSITPQQVDNGSTGSCGNLQYSLDKTQFTCANVGNNTVLFRVTDAGGNISSATATVTVTDINGVCNANVVSTGAVTTKLCSGQAVDVPYSVSNAFNNGNIFTAQLSNAGGSFTSPVNIGALSATSAGVIKAIIPAGTTQGAGYRIRVIASNPAATGSDNGTAIAIYAIPVLTSTPTPPAVCNNSLFTYTPTATPSGTTASWSRAVVAGISNAAASGTGGISETLLNTTTSPININYVYQLSNNGCNSNAYTVVVTVNPSPIARAKNISVNLGAGGSVSITPQQVDNGSTGSCGTLQYSLDKTQFTCANIGNNTVTLTITDGAGNRSSATATVTVTDANGVCVVKTNTITTGSVSSSLCKGQPVDVPYNVSNSFAAGNVFTAQLSNASGLFTSPVNIGSLSATGAGVIKTTIPSGTATGTGYRIRVIASNPAAIGTDNGANISIAEIPVLTSTLTPPGICNNAAFFYTPAASVSGTTFTWSRAAVAGITNSSSSGTGGINEVLTNTTSTLVNVTYVYRLSSNGCSSGPYNVVVQVSPSPLARTGNITAVLNSSGSVTITPQQVDNGSVGYCGSLQYSLDKTQFTCANIGINTVTLTVTDGAGNKSSATATVTVTDQTAPVITGASASPNVLSNTAPNAKMVNVTLNYSTADNCSGTTVTLSVRSNEPESGLFKQDRSPDWNILSNQLLQLRAERNPAGTGRIYTITITATDARGNRSTREVLVTVPAPAASSIFGGAKDLQEELLENAESNLRLSVSPNPSSSFFLLRAKSGSTQPVTLRILDVAGRLVETKASIPANESVQIGQLYRPGTYVIEAIQGGQKALFRIIKTAP